MIEGVLRYIVQNIAGTDSFEIKEDENEYASVYTVVLPQEMIGKIIGKSGRTINAIRSILHLTRQVHKSTDTETGFASPAKRIVLEVQPLV